MGRQQVHGQFRQRPQVPLLCGREPLRFGPVDTQCADGVARRRHEAGAHVRPDAELLELLAAAIEPGVIVDVLDGHHAVFGDDGERADGRVPGHRHRVGTHSLAGQHPLLAPLDEVERRELDVEVPRRQVGDSVEGALEFLGVEVVGLQRGESLVLRVRQRVRDLASIRDGHPYQSRDPRRGGVGTLVGVLDDGGAVGVHLLVRPVGEEDDASVRDLPPEPLCEFETGAVRQVVLGHQAVDVAVVDDTLRFLDRRASLDGRVQFSEVRPKRLREVRPGRLVRVHTEDAYTAHFTTLHPAIVYTFAANARSFRGVTAPPSELLETEPVDEPSDAVQAAVDAGYEPDYHQLE